MMAIITQDWRAVLLPWQRNTTFVADQPCDERRIAPARRTKRSLLTHGGIAGQALRRIHEVQSARSYRACLSDNRFLYLHATPLSLDNVRPTANQGHMTPALTDRSALAHFRARARRAPALFLHQDVADEIKERLTEVNRTFTAPAVVTPFPEIWRETLPGARIVPDDDTLALEPAAHDLVIHALALHWANDPVGQIIQSRRALQPDGLFIGALFGGRSLHELRAALAQAESDLHGTLSPRVLPMGEIRDLGALLQRAGLALPVADSFSRQVLYRDLRHLVSDLRAMGESNALAQRRRAPMPRALLARTEAIYRDSFADAQGRLPATVETLFLTGWAPAENQQKPLRPGSAAARLAEALNTTETPLDPENGTSGD